MAISWSDWYPTTTTQKWRIGIDAWWDGANLIRFNIWVDALYAMSNDQQTVYWNNGNHTYTLVNENEQLVVYNASIAANRGGYAKVEAFVAKGTLYRPTSPYVDVYHSVDIYSPPVATVPAAPAAPTITGLQQNQATVNMVLPSDGGSALTDTALVLYTVPSGGTYFVGDDVADLRTSHTFTGLTRATTYYAEVWAFNAVGAGPRSPRTAFTTLPDPPTLAGTPAATNIARTSFVVPTALISDTGGQAPSQYRVQVNTSATDVGASVVTQTSWAAITVGSRSPLTTYYYRVAAYNSGGWGAYTAWASVTTLDAVPDDPAAPAISTISETSAYVSWAAPALNGATLDNYLVRVCTGNDPNAYVKTYTLPTGVTSVSVSGLIKGTWYNVFVKALATPTDSGWSQPGVFKTDGSWSTLRPWIKSGGVWYRALVWKNDGGTWKRVYTGLNVGGTWRRELD